MARATVDVAAPPERVFHALTDPAELAAWWGGPGRDAPGPGPSDSGAPGRDRAEWRVDVRPGGRWSVRGTDAGGGVATARGVYRVVDAPRTLEFSWQADGDAAPGTVRYDLAPQVVDGVPGTRVTVTHTSGPTGATACAPQHLPSGAPWPVRHLAALFHRLRPALQPATRPTLQPAWCARPAAAARAGRPDRRLTVGGC